MTVPGVAAPMIDVRAGALSASPGPGHEWGRIALVRERPPSAEAAPRSAGDRYPPRQGLDRGGRRRELISLGDAPAGDVDFDSGAVETPTIDPHGLVT